jgi:hypothetical protein
VNPACGRMTKRKVKIIRVVKVNLFQMIEQKDGEDQPNTVAHGPPLITFAMQRVHDKSYFIVSYKSGLNLSLSLCLFARPM